MLPDTPDLRTRKARVYRGLGKICEDYQSPETALIWLDRGLAELRSADVIEEALLYHRKGSALIGMGAYLDGHEVSERSLSLLPVEARDQRADVLVNLGIIACMRGFLAQGIEYYYQALAIYEQSHNTWRKIAVRQNLGIEREIAGDWDGAAEEYSQALALAEQLGIITLQINLKTLLGILYTNKGDHSNALLQLLECQDLASTYHLNEWLSACQSALADLYLRQNATDQAELLLTSAHEQATALNLQYHLPEIHRGWALVHCARGHAVYAVRAAIEAVDIAHSLADPLEEGKSLRVLGQAYIRSGLIELAQSSFAASLNQLGNRDPYEAARTTAVWATLLLSGIDMQRGIALLQEARCVFTRLGAQRDLGHVDTMLAWLEHQINEVVLSTTQE